MGWELAVAGVMAVAGAAMSYAGTKQQVDWQAQQAKAAARSAEHDAALKRAAAEAELENGRLLASRDVSGIRGAGGATGTIVGSGSLLQTELEAALLGEYNAQLRAYSSRLGAAQSQYGAEVRRAEARGLRALSGRAALTAALSSLASSGGSIAGAMIR